MVLHRKRLWLTAAASGRARVSIGRHPARQQGNGALLTFTLPVDSTDKKKLTETPSVEIYRIVAAPGATAPGKPPSHPVDTIPSDLVDTYKAGARFEFRDELDPAELARQPGQQVTYTVRTRLSGEHASADSNPVKLPAYPAPAPASELRATVMEKTIALSWTPSRPPPGVTSPEASLDYRVYRADVSASGANGASGTTASGSAAEAALQPISLVNSTTYQDIGLHRRLRTVPTATSSAPSQNSALTQSSRSIRTPQSSLRTTSSLPPPRRTSSP